MSGTFPISSAQFETLGIKSIQDTILSKSVSGKKLSRQIDSQRWSFTARIITAKRSDVYGELMAFIVKQRSGKENFTIIPPEVTNARGTASGIPTGTASAGATSITLGGTGTGTLKAGDFIKFASHDKVYMVVADQSDISTGTLTIEPPLTTAITTSTIIYDNVPFTVYLTNDIQEFGVVGNDKDGNLLYQFEIDVEEAL
jgi:hypothetical protein